MFLHVQDLAISAEWNDYNSVLLAVPLQFDFWVVSWLMVFWILIYLINVMKHRLVTDGTDKTESPSTDKILMLVGTCSTCISVTQFHDNVIKWKHFPRYWPFVRGIHRFPVNSPHKGQWPGASIFTLICVWINGWVNIREAGDLRRYRAHMASE